MAQFFDEITVVGSYAADGGHDFGFVPLGYKLVLQSGGPIEYSFDGATDHGSLGPSGTRPMEVQIEGGGAKSRIWLKGAGSETVSVWGWD